MRVGDLLHKSKCNDAEILILVHFNVIHTAKLFLFTQDLVESCSTLKTGRQMCVLLLYLLGVAFPFGINCKTKFCHSRYVTHADVKLKILIPDR